MRELPQRSYGQHFCEAKKWSLCMDSSRAQNSPYLQAYVHSSCGPTFQNIDCSSQKNNIQAHHPYIESYAHPLYGPTFHNFDRGSNQHHFPASMLAAAGAVSKGVDSTARQAAAVERQKLYYLTYCSILFYSIQFYCTISCVYTVYIHIYIYMCIHLSK